MKKIIFLDRDGVINADPAEKRYVTCWRDFRFLPGSVEALKRLNEFHYDIAVISNQAGVSRGLFSLEDLEEVNREMLKALGKFGVKLKKVYYCPHMDEDNCSCRKPKTGLFIKAVEELGIKKISWQEIFFIGDGKFDVWAGKSIGLKTILVLSGKTTKQELGTWQIKPDFTARNLLEAVEKIVLAPNYSQSS